MRTAKFAECIKVDILSCSTLVKDNTRVLRDVGELLIGAKKKFK